MFYMKAALKQRLLKNFCHSTELLVISAQKISFNLFKCVIGWGKLVKNIGLTMLSQNETRVPQQQITYKQSIAWRKHKTTVTYSCPHGNKVTLAGRSQHKSHVFLSIEICFRIWNLLCLKDGKNIMPEDSNHIARIHETGFPHNFKNQIPLLFT